MNTIQLQGTLYLGPYKGYHGSAKYDPEASIFHGEISDTRDVITFQGREPVELAAAFQASVDDYLAYCESRGEKPEKPFSGKFVVRMSPDLHHQLATMALNSEQSLNQLVCRLLREAADKHLFEPAQG